jgi:hypothetical protein
MAINELFSSLLTKASAVKDSAVQMGKDTSDMIFGRGVLGNVGDAVVSMGKEAQEAYSQHSNAVGKNVFKAPTAPSFNRVDESAYSDDATKLAAIESVQKATRTDAQNTLFDEITERNTQRQAFSTYDAQKKVYDEQQGLMSKLSGKTALGKDETKETVLEAAQKAGTINESQKSALDYFMVQNQGKAYTPDSIDKTFAARDESVVDKFQTKSATFLETPTSMPGMSKIGDDGDKNQFALKNDLITLGAGAAVGGIVGSAMYDNAEGGMLTGLAGAGLGRGIARAINKNIDSISAYGMKTVLGDELVKEGDKIGYGLDDAAKAKMEKLGFADAKNLDVDVTTGKVINKATKAEVNLAEEGKKFNATELTMEDIGLGAKVGNKDEQVGVFTKNLIDAEEAALKTSVNNINADTTIASHKAVAPTTDQKINADGYDINVPANTQLTDDMIKQQVLKQREINLLNEKNTISSNTVLSKEDKDKQLFFNEMKAQALTKDGARNASLLEDQAKAAHAAIFKPQKNVAVDAKQADTMNLNNLKSKKENDLGAVQNMAKNMLTNPGGAGRLTGQYRNMILGGAALSGVAFTSNKRDYRRGINANKGNRI